MVQTQRCDEMRHLAKIFLSKAPNFFICCLCGMDAGRRAPGYIVRIVYESDMLPNIRTILSCSVLSGNGSGI